MNKKASQQRCGFVAVLGAPNAGKSTLINELVGAKVSIVSPKVQTTRVLVRGIALHEQSQVIFIDTPGLFAPQKRFEKAMVSAAWDSQNEADIVLLLCDVSKKKSVRDTKNIIEKLEFTAEGRPVILVLNKVDLVRPPELMPITQELNDLYNFDATFMISADKARGTDDLMSYVSARIPESPWLYPEDQLTDMPMRLMAAEITREKLFHRLHEELPYGLTVETEEWNPRDDGSVFISQVIIIAREAHKGIVLGKGGRFIKTIGEQARTELEEIMEQRVHLKLFVKVSENWSENPEVYELWGLDYHS